MSLAVLALLQQVFPLSSTTLFHFIAHTQKDITLLVVASKNLIGPSCSGISSIGTVDKHIRTHRHPTL